MIQIGDDYSDRVLIKSEDLTVFNGYFNININKLRVK